MTNFGDLTRYGLPARKPWDGNIKAKVFTLISEKFEVPRERDKWSIEKLEHVCVYIGIDWNRRSKPGVITSVFDDFVRAFRLWTYEDITLFNKLSDKIRLRCNTPNIPSHPIRRHHWGKDPKIVHVFLLIRLFGCPVNSRYLRGAADFLRRIPTHWHTQNREAREVTTAAQSNKDSDDTHEIEVQSVAPTESLVTPVPPKPEQEHRYNFQAIFNDLAKTIAPPLIQQGYSSDMVVAAVADEVCNWVAQNERKAQQSRFQRILSSVHVIQDEMHALTGMPVQLDPAEYDHDTTAIQQLDQTPHDYMQILPSIETPDSFQSLVSTTLPQSHGSCKTYPPP